MRQSGEQWVEVIDGKKHMLKAVENPYETCQGCTFGCESCDVCHYCLADGGKCPVNKMDMVIKDLGILNEDGCLPSPLGGYPKIIHEVDQNRTENGDDVHYDNLWCVEIHEPFLICTNEYPTEQQAVDAWNRRV